MIEFICKFCNQPRKNRRSLGTHQVRCKMNPSRIDPVIDYKRRKTSNQWIKAIEENKPAPVHVHKGTIGNWLGKKHSTASKLKMSMIAKEQGRGGVKASRRIIYNGIKLGSTYEETLAIDLDKHSISWIIPKRFKYIDPNGIDRHYTSDFYLIDYDVYVDPKNDFLINKPNPKYGYLDIDKIRCVANQNFIRIFILNKDELSWNILYNKILNNEYVQ